MPGADRQQPRPPAGLPPRGADPPLLARGNSRGIRLGRLERSCKQTSVRRSCSLAVRHRRDQRQAVAGETLNAAAAALSEQPSSTARTSA